MAIRPTGQPKPKAHECSPDPCSDRRPEVRTLVQRPLLETTHWCASCWPCQGLPSGPPVPLSSTTFLATHPEWAQRTLQHSRRCKATMSASSGNPSSRRERRPPQRRYGHLGHVVDVSPPAKRLWVPVGRHAEISAIVLVAATL